MLINGKEVYRNEKVSIEVQKQVNKIPQLNTADLNSEIDPKKIEKTLDLISSSHGDNGAITFDGMSYGDAADYTSRVNRYQIYREMDTMEFIHRGLELTADDATAPNGEGDVLKVYSDDDEKKNILQELFFDKLDINNELWSIFYETIKVGDNFYEIIPDSWDNPKEIK